jgi:protein involved in polysaccharide export with SLBB domain
MTTNYNSNKAQAGVQPKFLPAGDLAVYGVYTFPAASPPTLGAGDTITMMSVPAGATVTGVTLDVDKLDTGGSPAIKLNVGDAVTANRFVNQSTAGQAGGYQVPNINGGIGFQYAATTPILVTVQTAAAGAVQAGAAVRLVLNYTMDP